MVQEGKIKEITKEEEGGAWRIWEEMWEETEEQWEWESTLIIKATSF